MMAATTHQYNCYTDESSMWTHTEKPTSYGLIDNSCVENDQLQKYFPIQFEIECTLFAMNDAHMFLSRLKIVLVCILTK